MIKAFSRAKSEAYCICPFSDIKASLEAFFTILFILAHSESQLTAWLDTLELRNERTCRRIDRMERGTNDKMTETEGSSDGGGCRVEVNVRQED